MRTAMNRLMVLLVGATIAIATVGVGYGLWFETLTIQGQVETGSVALAFVNTPGTPHVTPYTNDDNVVNNVAVDPDDTGSCAVLPPSLLTSCDPRSTSVWSVVPRDEDGDGAADEDPADGVDQDGDLKVDEDGLGGWVTPFPAAAAGPDIGQTFAFVEGVGNKTLRVDLFSPAVFFAGAGVFRVYSPTAYAKVVNTGTVPVVVVEVEVTLVPPYELWDRNQDSVITDNPPLGVCNLPLGDECAAPLIAEVIGLTEGATVLMPGVPVDIEVRVYMTPAADPTKTYALTITITGNQFNEP